MASLCKIDMQLFEDWNYKLARFGEHFGAAAPRASKDAAIQRMVLEARLHAFVMCHAAFGDLLLTMYEQSDLSKKEGSDSDNAIGELLTWMHKQRMVSMEELRDIADQFDSWRLFSYEKEWLETAEAQHLFDERCKKLSRYYHRMSTVSGMLAQRLVVSKESHARV